MDTTVLYSALWIFRMKIYKNKLIGMYVAQPGRFLKEKALARRMQDPLYAMVMQAVEEAEVTFAGINNTTGDVLLAGQIMIIGMQPGISTISSIGLCDIPGFEGSEGSLLADRRQCGMYESECGTTGKHCDFRM